MSYSVNPNLFRSIFAVPTEIVDKHIRLASAQQLKVLLWILKNAPENPDIDEMCKALKINKEDVDDYLQYWVLTGVLQTDGKSVTVPVTQPVENIETAKTTKATEKEEPKKTVEEVEHIPSKPTSSEIAIRIEESPEIGHLFNEAQVKLGKTIGYDGQCALLLLHDHYGLPAEVLFMLIDYCVSVGKTNYSYIVSVGKDWGHREIDTLDKAAQQIAALKNINTVWNEFARNVGITTPRPTIKQIPYFRKWTSDYKFSTEMIILAYEEMADRTGGMKFSYVDKVLESWHKEGYKTPADVENSKAKAVSTPKKATAGKASSKINETSAASYDLDEFEQRSIHADLIYKKKGDKK